MEKGLQIEEKMEDDPALLGYARNILFPLNLLVFTLQMPLSLFNVLLICRTSLLHRNLKLVLFAQSACFFSFGLAHFVQICIILNIIHHQGYDQLVEELVEAKERTHPIILFTIQFGNLIGHALIVERVLATIWARKYEHYRGVHFTVAWFLPMFLFSLYSCMQQIMLHSDLENPISVLHFTQGAVVSNYLSLAFSLAEIIIFSIVGAKNLERYKEWLGRNNNRHNLSERYQLSENIRTARQLAPTMTFHFVNILFTSILPILLSFQLVHNEMAMDMIVIVSLLSQSICNALIEFTLISRHDALRKNALKMLKAIPTKLLLQIGRPSKNRIRDKTTESGGDEQQQRQQQIAIIKFKAIESAIGTRLSIGNVQNESDKHFVMLKNQWG